MTRDIKARFRDLNVIESEDFFVRLPSAASLFQDLRLYQNSAIGHLTALGVLDHGALREGVAQLRLDSLPATLANSIDTRNVQQSGLLNFLVGGLSELSLAGPEGLYRRVGLPSKQLSI
jgi:hypothetical protein